MCMCLLRNSVCLFCQCVNGMASTIIARRTSVMTQIIKSLSAGISIKNHPRRHDEEHFCFNQFKKKDTHCIPSAVNKLTQTAFSVLVCDHKRAIAAAWTALNVKIPKQQSQRSPLWHSKPPLTPGVTRVGAWIVLRSQSARLCSQHCMSTAITWNITSTTERLRQEKVDRSKIKCYHLLMKRLLKNDCN